MIMIAIVFVLYFMDNFFIQYWLLILKKKKKYQQKLMKIQFMENKCQHLIVEKLRKILFSCIFQYSQWHKLYFLEFISAIANANTNTDNASIFYILQEQSNTERYLLKNDHKYI